MGRFGDDQIEEVRTRADIVEVIGAHVRLRRTGRNFVGLCPFHNEKTPSFSVNAERGFFHCFGCGAGGTVYNFVMRMEGLTFPEAVRSLARRYGVTLPEHEVPGGPSGTEREQMMRANEVAAEFFAHVLWNTEDGALARDYLKKRAIAPETARAFKLGFAPARPASLAKALEKRGLRDAGVKLGLIRRDQDGVHDLFRARLMFPIRDAQGRVVAFGGRVLDARLPKYINSPESPLYSKTRTLYGLYESRQAVAARDRAIVVEGYIDAIALWQAGFKEVVAGCGTALTVEQLRLLARHTKNVIACFDGDEAGRKASLRALEIFLEAGLLGRAVFIPSGFDPDTFIGDRGAQAFGQLAEHAELLIDYFLAEQAAEARKTIEARARAAARVAEVLRLVRNPFEFDLLARKAAPLLGVGEEVLRREARTQPRSPGRNRAARTSPAPAPPAAADAGSRAEIGLLALALFRPELRAEIAAAAPAAWFDDADLAGALRELCATDAAHGALEGWLSERLTPEQQARLSEVAVGAVMDDPERARALASDLVAALQRRRRQRGVETLRRAAHQAAPSAGDEATAAGQAIIALRREGRS
jgi:DNA primase